MSSPLSLFLAVPLWALLRRLIESGLRLRTGDFNTMASEEDRPTEKFPHPSINRKSPIFIFTSKFIWFEATNCELVLLLFP